MAVSISIYNHTAKLFANKEVTFTTLKVMLLDNTAVFDAANTSIADVAGTPTGSTYPKELFGNGWTQNGETLANVTVTQVTTNDAKFDADDVSVIATGGPIPPTKAFAAVIYDATTGNPLFYIDFGQDEQAGESTPFKFVWNTNGIAQWQAA